MPDDVTPAAAGAAAEILNADPGTSPPPEAPGAGSPASPPGSPSPEPQQGPEWLAGLSEDLRGDKTLGRFQSVEDLSKSYLELRSTVGDTGALRPPKQGEDPTQWDGWHALGAPKTLEDVKVDRPQMPDGVTYDEGREKAFLERAVAKRYPAHIIQDIVNLAAEEAQAQAQAKATEDADEAKQLAEFKIDQRRQLDEQMRGEWGTGPQRDENLDLARRAARYIGFTAEEQTTIEEQAGSFPLLEKLAKVGQIISEHSLDGAGVNVEDAKARLEAINAKLADPTTRSQVTDADKAERERLYRQIYGRAS